MLTIIILLEYSAGALAAKGAWDLCKSRKSSAGEFNAAKSYANLGGGIALLVWFGLFTAIGGSYFQMWQTELGGASLQGSFQFTASIGIVLLFVNMSEQDS
jgi:predicted small integral membrane protein